MKCHIRTLIAGLLVVGFQLVSSGCTWVGTAVPLQPDPSAALAKARFETQPGEPAQLDDETAGQQDWSRLIKEGREHLLLKRYTAAEQSLLTAFEISKRFRATDVRRRVSFGNLEQLADQYSSASYGDSATRVLKIIARETQGRTEFTYSGLSDLMLNLGDLQLRKGSLADAEVSYQRALDLRIEKSGQDSASLITPYQRLSNLSIKMELLERAALYVDRSLELTETHFGPDAREAVISRIQAGAVYLQLERYPEALVHYKRAIKAQRAIEPSSIPEAAALNAIANVFLQMDRLDEANESVDLALSILESRELTGIDRAMVQDTKARILGALGEIDAAVRLFNEVMLQANAAPPTEARELYESYERFLIDQNRSSDAEMVRKQIDRIDQLEAEQRIAEPSDNEGEPLHSEPIETAGDPKSES